MRIAVRRRCLKLVQKRLITIAACKVAEVQEIGADNEIGDDIETTQIVAAENEGIHASSASQGVTATQASDCVIACTAINDIDARRTFQNIIAGSGPDIVDEMQCVCPDLQAMRLLVMEKDRQIDVIGCVVDGVVATATMHIVVSGVSEERVIVMTAIEPVVVVAAAKFVISGTTLEGVFAVTTQHHVVSGTADDHVIVVPAIQRVVSGSTIQSVIAAFSVKRVVSIVAVQFVTLLAPKERVITGIAVKRILTRVSVQVVVATAAMQLVIAVVSIEPVIAGSTVKLVGTGTTMQKVIVGAFDNRRVSTIAGVRIGATGSRVVVGVQDKGIGKADVDGKNTVVEVAVSPVEKILKTQGQGSCIGFQNAGRMQEIVRIQVDRVAVGGRVIGVILNERLRAVRRNMVEPRAVAGERCLRAIGILELESSVFQVEMRVAAISAIAVGNDKKCDSIAGADIEKFARFPLDQIAAAALQRCIRPDEFNVLIVPSSVIL